MITMITAMTRSMSTSGSYPCDGHRKRRDVCQGGIAPAAIDGLSKRKVLSWVDQPAPRREADGSNDGLPLGASADRLRSVMTSAPSSVRGL